MVKIIECPRDAMQGMHTFIPTHEKVRYLQMLLQVGFNTIDIGSFVSPKVIPQMKDTQQVIELLDLSQTQSKLLVIVANLRGAEQATSYSQIDYIGFPFSISENFQMRNTQKTIAQSLEVLQEIITLSSRNNKEVVAYLSMSFGNPYGDVWNEEIVAYWVDKLVSLGIKTISLSDTIGMAQPQTIQSLFSYVTKTFPVVEFGAHFHTTYYGWYEKVNAAYLAGCRRFDGAIQGYGGCPMAKDELVGNLSTEKLFSFLQMKQEALSESLLHFESAYNEATRLFSIYG